MTTHSNGFDVIGAIEVKWKAAGGEAGFLGKPLENEQPADNSSDNKGRTQRFVGGVIAWHPDIGVAYEMHGAILARWRAAGEVRFAFPITDESEAPDGKGRYNHFRTLQAPGKPDSSIYWHPDAGAHVVFGAIRDKWASLGWERSAVGYPIGDEAPVARDVIQRGAVQPFQHGFIAWHPSLGAGRDGAHEVHGAIATRWNELGRTNFGFPITDELTPMETVAGIFQVPSLGHYNHFRALHLPGTPESSIYWHPDTGAHEVFGAIRDKWASLGWERSAVGYPTGREGPVHGGAVQTFQRGFIAWHPSIGSGRDGAHEVHGAIATRWNELGRANFGFPITDETATPDKIGRYNHFRAVHLSGAPESSIYWHPDHGAHEVYGAIRAKWASLGWEISKVGYPVGAEHDRQGAGRIQDFQTGAIAWVSGLGAWVDWFRMRRIIVTPSGTALGGWVELEIHQNGHTFFRGHMHNSSDIVSYKFIIRATYDIPPPIGSPAGSPPEDLLLQVSGEVDENFDWSEAGYHPLLRQNWFDVERGAFGVSKSYEKTGLLDDIGQLMLDSISFVILSATVGGPVASSLLLAKGLSSVTKTPIGGLGGAFGIVAMGGASILAGPLFAFPVFIGTALVTSLLFKQREMSPEEYEFAKIVFGDTLPPRERIVLTNVTSVKDRAFVIPAMDGKTALVNIGDEALNNPGGPMRHRTGGKPVPGQRLIHELVHVWQFHRMNRFIPGYVCRGLASADYDPPPAGSRWGSDFGLEQEAKTVDLWFERWAFGWTNLAELRDMLNSDGARNDPYFRYIERNIRMAEDDHD